MPGLELLVLSESLSISLGSYSSDDLSLPMPGLQLLVLTPICKESHNLKIHFCTEIYTKATATDFFFLLQSLHYFFFQFVIFFNNFQYPYGYFSSKPSHGGS